MGLDSVEIVLEVEEEFGINISDEQAEKVRTAADLAQLAHRVRERDSGAVCESASVFYDLRGA